MVGPLVINPAGRVQEVKLVEALVLAGHRFGIKLPNMKPTNQTGPRRRVVREGDDP